MRILNHIAFSHIFCARMILHSNIAFIVLWMTVLRPVTSFHPIFRWIVSCLYCSCVRERDQLLQKTHVSRRRLHCGRSYHTNCADKCRFRWIEHTHASHGHTYSKPQHEWHSVLDAKCYNRNFFACKKNTVFNPDAFPSSIRVFSPYVPASRRWMFFT